MNPIGSEVPVLVPAYRPGEPLVTLVHELLSLGVSTVIVVDDGSGPEFEPYFRRIEEPGKVHLIRQAVNLGKGAALKMGMNYALVHVPGCLGVVTADADGQHHPQDIVEAAGKLRESPDTLVLGVRAFGKGTPWKSRMGNGATRVLMRLIAGQNLTDTQTGLRGISAALIPHLLRIAPTGYEFELEMLIACKHQGFPVVQHPIRMIYLDNNMSSHFRPVFDSMRIYFLLLRFSVLALLTAALDNIVFFLAFSAGGSIAQSQVAARLVAMAFNYAGARNLVFHSQQRQAIVLPKYVLLVACNGFVSYGLIQFFHQSMGLSPIWAKLIAESLLFIANFAIQRDFVFTRQAARRTATDWDLYYTSVAPTAKLTRRYTTATLLNMIRRYVKSAPGTRQLSIIEIGGANSCFVDSILNNTDCASYDVIDTNQYGLSLLAQRLGSRHVVRLHEQSVLDLALDTQADLAFSVGLVEHFSPQETARAVLAHFDVLRPGGIAIITFPTPTFLYRIARNMIEALGLWKFPDERPLDPTEVISTLRKVGDVLYEKTLWPLVLTQELIVARKHAGRGPRLSDGR